MHIPILGYGILFAFHTVLEVALPKQLVKRPESAFASSIPILAKPLARNGVLYSGVLEIVKVVAIISSVVSEAVFISLSGLMLSGLRLRGLSGCRLTTLIVSVPDTVTRDINGMFR